MSGPHRPIRWRIPRVSSTCWGCSAQAQFRIPRKVIKGGSFACAESDCMRYRPAAGRPQMIDTGTSHIGFGCVVRPSDAIGEKVRTAV